MKQKFFMFAKSTYFGYTKHMLTQQNFSKPLVAWYNQHKRDLPWRNTKDPYAIFVSEIMLQQTRVEAVKKYYAPFIQKFPTTKALSNASQEELLRAWQGLGYYRRAQNLQRACMQIETEYNGQFPTTQKELSLLYGVGLYTSCAVASICFNERVPAVDGNVLRVFARVTALPDNVLLEKTKQNVYQQLLPLVPKEAGNFNQAFMDLGSSICLPANPLCQHCPLAGVCKGKHNPSAFPVREKKQNKPAFNKTVAILYYKDAICIEKRKENGLLAGMYAFPNLDGWLTEAEATAWVEKNFGNVQALTQQYHKKHVFTHQIWNMRVYVFTLSSIKTTSFVPDISAYPIPTAFLKCLP